MTTENENNLLAASVDKGICSIGIDPASNIKSPSKVIFHKTDVVTFEELKKIITSSNWSPGTFKNDYRNKENWIESSIIGLDFDEGMSLIEAEYIFGDFKHIIATTKSHQKPKHDVVCDRFRVILFLDHSCSNIKAYEATLSKLISEYGADRACTNADRFFFKCQEIISSNEKGNFVEVVLPPVENSAVKTLVAQSSVSQSYNNNSKKELSRKTLLFFLDGAKPGTWNSTLYSVAKNMNSCGYTEEEAIDYINSKKIPGFKQLDKSDLKTISSAYKKILKQKDDGQQRNSMIDFLESELEANFRVYNHTAFFWLESETIVKKITLTDLHGIIFRKFEELKKVTHLHREIVELTNTFLLRAQKPPFILEKFPSSFSLDKSELTFRYIDVNTLTESGINMPTPCFDALLNNCVSNKQQLAAYIWLVLNPQFKSRQYCLLNGVGKNGKSALMNWIMKLVGSQSYTSLSSKNDHWLSDCVGKRIGFFAELPSTTFVMSGPFKALTGGDSVSISQKYEKAFSTVLDTKLFISTNSTIDIENTVASRSRIILVDMVQPKSSEVIPNFETKMQEETPGILQKCKQAFDALYDYENAEIRTEYEAFDDHADSYEEIYKLAFEKTFKISEGEKLLSICVSDALMQTNSKYDRFFIIQFKKWMIEKVPSISKVKISGNIYFKNLALKQEMVTALRESELTLVKKDA